jgi:hypothetical protein
MGRMFLTTLAVLLAAGAVFTRPVAAGLAGQAPQAPTATNDPSIVPEYLRVVPMYRTHPGLNIDIPVNATIYPPDIIPPQFQWRDDNPAATICASKSSLASTQSRSAYGPSAKK